MWKNKQSEGQGGGGELASVLDLWGVRFQLAALGTSAHGGRRSEAEEGPWEEWKSWRREQLCLVSFVPTNPLSASQLCLPSDTGPSGEEGAAAG